MGMGAEPRVFVFIVFAVLLTVRRKSPSGVIIVGVLQILASGFVRKMKR